MRKWILGKRLVFSSMSLVLLGLTSPARSASLSGPLAVSAQEKPSIILTTADLKQDYEIIAVITHYQQFAKLSMKDPLLGALKKGMEDFEKKVIDAGADAVVGLRFHFENPSQGEEGRLLIYGTAVKLK